MNRSATAVSKPPARNASLHCRSLSCPTNSLAQATSSRRNALEQLLMPAVIVELDDAVLHTGDERLALEDVRVSTPRSQRPGLAERGAEIADDIPLRSSVRRAA